MFWGILDQNSGVHGNRKPPLTYNGESGVSTFSRLLLIRSFLYLQVTRTCIISRMSSNFDQIGPLTRELAALERLKKFPIDLKRENAVSMLARSFWGESSSKLLVIRTGVKALSSSILGRIRQLILELLAIEWRKFHTYELEDLWSQLNNLDQILYAASLGCGKGCIRFWGRFDQNSGFHGNRNHHSLIMGNMMYPPFLGCFWSDPFYTHRYRGHA